MSAAAAEDEATVIAKALASKMGKYCVISFLLCDLSF
jgi:hypothetical protein